MSPLRDFVPCNGGADGFQPVEQDVVANEEEVFLESENNSVFDEIVGAIEDIVVDDKFQNLQADILEKHFHHFDVSIKIQHHQIL